MVELYCELNNQDQSFQPSQWPWWVKQQSLATEEYKASFNSSVVNTEYSICDSADCSDIEQDSQHFGIEKAYQLCSEKEIQLVSLQLKVNSRHEHGQPQVLVDVVISQTPQSQHSIDSSNSSFSGKSEWQSDSSEIQPWWLSSSIQEQIYQNQGKLQLIQQQSSLNAAKQHQELDVGSCSKSNPPKAVTPSCTCLLSGGAMLTDRRKLSLSRHSEDSYMITSNGLAVGVADGVGGYYQYGIDSGEYARELMTQSKRLLEANQIEPMSVLKQSHSLTHLEGAATACLLKLHNNKLRIVNLGDSGCIIIRNRKIIFQMKPQQYTFNVPYQMSREDAPTDAQQHEVDVQIGDTIILGTDGLFDNVFADQIVECVQKYEDVGLGAVLAAESLAQLAFTNSIDRTFCSPWVQGLRRVQGAQSVSSSGSISGGKQDDITVVISVVVQREEFLQQRDRYDEEQQQQLCRMYRQQSSFLHSAPLQTTPCYEKVKSIGIQGDDEVLAKIATGFDYC